MRADVLLSRLSRVQPRGNGQWMCRCPSHEDRTASLSVGEIDGRILLHCFAGCEADEVLGAVGLEFKDLYPERITDHAQPQRKARIPASDLLRILELELTVVAVVSSDIETRGYALPEDWQRFKEAAATIIQARASLDE